jgi:hypothetical protein
MMPAHTITLPNVPNPPVANGRIEVTGQPLANANVAEVYGKVFPTADDVPNSGDPYVQDDLHALVDGIGVAPDNGCRMGTQHGAGQYTFYDADGQAIPVNDSSPKNHLRTWVLFAGETDYTLSNNTVHFTAP